MQLIFTTYCPSTSIIYRSFMVSSASYFFLLFLLCPQRSLAFLQRPLARRQQTPIPPRRRAAPADTASISAVVLTIPDSSVRTPTLPPPSAISHTSAPVAVIPSVAASARLKPTSHAPLATLSSTASAHSAPSLPPPRHGCPSSTTSCTPATGSTSASTTQPRVAGKRD